MFHQLIQMLENVITRVLLQWADLWVLVWAGQQTTASAPPPQPSGAASLSSLRQVRSLVNTEFLDFEKCYQYMN